MLPHADADAEASAAAAAAARPRWWPVAAAAVARRRSATIHGRLVGEEDSQLTASTAAVSSRLKTNLTRSLTLVRGLPRTLSHTCRLLLARSFVRYLPIKRRRSLRPPHEKHYGRTHAHTTQSERPHAHDADRFVYVRRPLFRPVSRPPTLDVAPTPPMQ